MAQLPNSVLLYHFMAIKLTERVHSNFKKSFLFADITTIVKLNSEDPDGKKQLEGNEISLAWPTSR